MADLLSRLRNARTRLRNARTHLHNGTLAKRVQIMVTWRIGRVALYSRAWARQRRTALWNYQAAKRHALNVRIQSGVRMRLHADSHLSHEIYQGDFEWQERRFLNAFLRPGDTFVDVGANVGLFTLIAAHQVGPSGRVHAFEPCAKTHRRLVSNISLNPRLNRAKNISCHQLALSDSAACAALNVSLEEFDAHNSLAPLTQGQLTTTETVQTVTWDSFAQDNGLVGRVTLMKIDVEGWESRVLAGASQVLSRVDAPTLLIEFTEANAQAAGTSCAALYHGLEHLGYRMFTYDDKHKSLIHDPLRSEYPYVNLIAVKQLADVVTRLGSA